MPYAINSMKKILCHLFINKVNTLLDTLTPDSVAKFIASASEDRSYDPLKLASVISCCLVVIYLRVSVFLTKCAIGYFVSMKSNK